ncbi:hypothetical protein K652_03053 [Pseudomonas aeruginosa VRFPA02]|nr:hypothetical protein K652_03053 [Pseudomonas aeruginosa VRFPA02]
MKLPKLLAALALLAAPALAFAHPGHGEHGLVAGLAHPLTGLDHLLAMFAVGLWAAQQQGAARLALPCTFVGTMLVGGLLGFEGLQLPFMETGIAASVLALGLCVALAVRPGRRHAAQLRHPGGFAGRLPGRLRQPVGPAAVLRPRADPRPHGAGAQGSLQRTGRLAASPVEHRPAGRGGNLRRLPAGRAAHVRRSPGRPVAGGGLGRRAGRSAEGNLYRATLVGVPLQRRHRPLRPGFRG